MIESPHLYRANAPEGTSPQVITRVLEIERSQAGLGVHPIYSLNHLAHLSDVDYTFLRDIASRSVDGYVVYQIRKRDGISLRSIAAPLEPLQIAQRWLLDNVFSKLETHPASYAYQSGRSVRQCAEVHVGANWIIHFDLKDFFHQSDERDVYNLLVGSRYEPLVAFEIGRITTRMPGSPQDWLPKKYAEEGSARTAPKLPYTQRRLGYVPQGAPTSGAITNALALALDNRLEQLAASENLVYSRYADDITFSSSGSFSRPSAVGKVAKLSRAIAQAGYEVNASKTRIVPPGRRLQVLGILVDGPAVRLTLRTRNRIEYHLRGMEKFGIQQHQAHAGFDDSIGMLHFVRGLVDYAWDIEPVRATVYRQRLAAVIP